MYPLTLTKVLLALALSSAATAHMEQVEPAPIRSKFNLNIMSDTDIDYTMKEPLTNATFPCKGFHTLLGTPMGAPVATWAAGSQQSVTIGTQGGGQHMGGSCQVSISMDGGANFTVLHSYVGNCVVPGAEETVLAFRLPSDTPASDGALLSWTWMNHSGIREYYQNCAVITVTEAQGGSGEEEESVPFDQRPPLFVANLGNGCTTAEMADVMFPDPGPDVDVANPDAVPPIGECGTPVSIPADAPPVDAPAENTPVETPPADSLPMETPVSPAPTVDGGSMPAPGLGNGRMSCSCVCDPI
ncbi:uncharacterized protein DNG_04819 [Cephalotrichum gorgonifer]|uniref:Lytic polysaccharide monooxygenase n=1 Tax=Cephalotrichum gorgonifer TaxID=2041049 RepID=A0AAE8SUX7_9PEZI|nr:uncharacterized protein DNG_04819 [Cephalotrichum gorgonifer]